MNLRTEAGIWIIVYAGALAMLATFGATDHHKPQDVAGAYVRNDGYVNPQYTGGAQYERNVTKCPTSRAAKIACNTTPKIARSVRVA